jgi:high-affinity nickel-transport protein
VGTTDSILMLGAYGWAFVKPIRKLYYNITITFVSVTIALLIGGIEALGAIGDRFGYRWFLGAIGLGDRIGKLADPLVDGFGHALPARDGCKHADSSKERLSNYF